MFYKKRYKSKFGSRKGPLKVKYIVFFTFFIFIMLNFFSLWIVEKKIEPLLMTIAETEIKDLTTTIINNAIKNTVKRTDVNDLIIIRNHETKPTYSFNQSVYNKFLTNITDDISAQLADKTNQLDTDDNGSVLYTIPLGVVTGYSILSNLGPSVPVEMAIVSDLSPELKTKLTSSGINNTYLEVFVRIRVNIQVAIPSLTDKEIVETDVKVGDLFIPGEVPEYYGGTNENDPSILIEPKKDKN